MNYLILTNIFNYEIFVFILIFILTIETNCNLIVIPFNIKEIPSNDNQNFIYTNIEIGTPPIKIDSIINFQNSLFYSSNKNYLNISLDKTYNFSQSNSFKIISNTNISLSSIEFKNIISEQIYFYTDINCQNKINYTIYPILSPEININESLFLVIDLQVNNGMNKTYNIINILKALNIIDNYYWTIKLENFTTGKIIIGDLPHNYEEDNYKEKNITFINTYSNKNKIFWGIQFSSLQFADITITDIENIMIGKIEPTILEIFGSYEYINATEVYFFEKYKKNQICRRIFDKINGEDVHRIICDKDKFSKTDIELFPNLTLINVDLNYSFIFTGEELFMEKDNKIYFMIVSKVGRTEGEWELGRIFLNKYQFVMDSDNNLIGIYKDKIEDSESKEKNNTMLILIVSILILNFLIGLGVIIYYIRKNVCKSKKRLPELDDEIFESTNEKDQLKLS